MRARVAGSSAAASIAALAPLAARADAPMAYLKGYGARAYPVVSLTWGVLVISLAVVAIIGILLLLGLFWRRPPITDNPLDRPVARTGSGLSWIYIGVGISTVVLFGSAVWTFTVLADVSRPPQAPDLTIEVTGHQWWWEVRYTSADAGRVFTTANEIHIPVGRPVRFRLIGADVIHSFWVPALSGKTDVIPGQTNTMWLEASKAGTYRGQCTEFCGWQHAHMALFVVAEEPQAFTKWWDHQLEGAPSPATREIAEGRDIFIARCGVCHRVRGTSAGATFGPDLTHLMSRSTIAAGTLPNTPGHLSGWIADPQRIKPGNRMPTIYLSAAELTGVRRFLETLD